MNTQKPRNPLMAALMSLTLPGFGQLYNGEVNRGLLLFVGFTLCSIPLMVLIALYLPSALMLPMLVLANVVAIGLWIYGIGNAWKTARTLKDYTLKNWQKSGTYLAVFLGAMLFIFPPMIQYVRTNLVESFHLPSGSMTPTVLAGDIIFANKNYNCPQCSTAIERGDIGIFVYPNNRSHYYIKRIIALPGDKIEIQNQQVFINGTALSRREPEQNQEYLMVTEKLGEKEYQVQWLASDTDTLLELIVPPGEVFVLGDNRSKSNDSRKFGTVPMRDVVGKAGQIWFSKGENGVRWDRMGEVLQ